jgi:hypothetical protein
MEYQDALESGQRELKPGLTLEQAVQQYREKLVKKVRCDFYPSSPFVVLSLRRAVDP